MNNAPRSSFTLDESAISLGFLAAVGLRLSEPLQLTVRAERAVPAFSDVEAAGLTLEFTYRINRQMSVGAGHYRFSRGDRRDVSALDLKVTGYQLGLTFHL